MTLSDAQRFLRQGLGSQLVGRGILPLAGTVGRFTVLLGGNHLMLAAEAEAGQHELFDLAALRLRPSLSRAPLEGAHDAALDHRLQRIHAQGRFRTHEADALVAVCARGADQLVMGRPHSLPVEVSHRSDPVQDHAAGSRLDA